MYEKNRIKISVCVVIFFVAFAVFVFSQGFPYLASQDLLYKIQNEVSGERAWDMLSKISRYHRIRGGGVGSDYNRCVNDLAAELREKGIFSAPRYIQKPAFMCQILQERNTFGNSRFPFEGEHRKNDHPVVYDPKGLPGKDDALSHVVVLPWNEFYTEEHVNYIAENIDQVAKKLKR